MSWIWAPFAMCLVLTGIHGYLGLHIIRRKVIFVDLALAQIAAIGTIYAVFLGYPKDSLITYGFSLGSTFIGAALFSLARTRRDALPQEAFIGIVYAAASGLAILLLSRLTGEGEHLKYMLVGNILLVTWPQVLKTALIYSGVGLVHFLMRRPFFLISDTPELAVREGLRLRFWDFLFYATFGVVITSSVSIAGVLLVFCYLVVPGVCAILVAEDFRRQILTAWAFGVGCSAVGMCLSYYGDFPTGPAIVTAFGAGLILLLATLYFHRSESKSGALARLGLGAAAALTVIFVPYRLRQPVEGLHGADVSRLEDALHSDDEATQIEAIHHLEEENGPRAVESLVGLLETTRSDRLLEHLAHALATLKDPSSIPPLRRALDRSQDAFVRTEIATTLAELGDPSGAAELETLSRTATPLLAREKARKALIGLK